jgi:hypothetical protein
MRKTLTAAQLAEISQQKAHDRGWAHWEATLPADNLTGPALEGYNDAAQNYETRRQERIKEFDQRK